MSNSLNPVFGEWYIDKQIGTGTDGKVFSIYRIKQDKSKEFSMLKIIRLGDNRNERKFLSPNVDKNSVSSKEAEKFDSIIKEIKKNILSVQKSDGGKHFVKYEDLELRNSSDGKGKLILIRLEEMKSLSQLLEEFSFTYEETIRVGISVCRALMKCRTFNYIYPNLKPENILFDRNGVCKLGDFGSFSCLEPSKTAVAYKRTQYYMAPEFIKTGNINRTVDTYSLGLVLYMLSNRGRLPFSEPYPEKVTVNTLNEATVKRVAGDELPKPELCSEELWRIIKKACFYNAKERYHRPDDMLKDLKNLLVKKSFEASAQSDIYCSAVQSDITEPEVLIPSMEDATQPDRKVDSAADKLSAPDLKDEIQIPAATPVYKKAKGFKKEVQYASLPEIKKTKKVDVASIKKIAVTAMLALALLILFFVSLSMRLSGDEGEFITTLSVDLMQTALNYNNLILL